MACSKLNENVVTKSALPEYSDLFCTNLNKKMAVVKILSENVRKRKKLIEKTETTINQLV